MNIYFPKNHINADDHPSLWVQFHIQSIQYAVRLRLNLISFLNSYKIVAVKESELKEICRKLESIFWFWIDDNVIAEIIARLEKKLKNANEEEINQKIASAYRILSKDLEQIEKIITPQLLMKDVIKVGCKNIDVHINATCLIWLLNKKSEINKIA